jgi:hypothetical protein
MESLVSDIPAGEGKDDNLFVQCSSLLRFSILFVPFDLVIGSGFCNVPFYKTKYVATYLKKKKHGITLFFSAFKSIYPCISVFFYIFKQSSSTAFSLFLIPLFYLFVQRVLKNDFYATVEDITH